MLIFIALPFASLASDDLLRHLTNKLTGRGRKAKHWENRSAL